MKKIFSLILALALAFCCFGIVSCGKKDTVINVRTKTITVGITDAEPMNYYNSDKILVGFDTELAITVFNALGYEVRFKVIEWAQKYLEINAGTIDCIWNGFTSNSEDAGQQRSDLVNFSYNYMVNAQAIIRQKTTTAITTLTDFFGKSVAFEINSAGDSLISGITGGIINKDGQQSQMDAILRVKNGNSQYAVVDKLLAESIVKQSAYSALEVNGAVTGIEEEYYAIGFRKNADGASLRDKVNIMLEAFGKTGYLMELAKKYGVENQVITEFDK